MCVGGMTPAGWPLVIGPYVRSWGPLHRATSTKSSLHSPTATQTPRVLVHWKHSGVPSGATGLETAGCTSDPHSPQNLALEVKSSPKPVLLETEPSSRCPCCGRPPYSHTWFCVSELSICLRMLACCVRASSARLFSQKGLFKDLFPTAHLRPRGGLESTGRLTSYLQSGVLI